MTTRPLFTTKGSLPNQLAAQEKRAVDAVKELPPDMVLASPDADLIERLYKRFLVEPLQIHREAAYSPTGIAQTKIDVGEAEAGFRHPRFGPIFVEGARVELAVPFDGEEVFVDLLPSSFPGATVRGDVRHGEVILAYEGTSSRSEEITPYLERQLSLLDKWSSSSRSDCDAYNQRLRGSLGQAVAAQRQKILADRKTVASLPFPVRRRSDPSTVFNIALPPRRQRPVNLQNRPAAPGSAPGPTISAEDFASILADIRSMGLAAERYPDTFGTMPEPALREVALVVLNNQFGPSGGELFSRLGKSDIAIMHESGAVFIAECKFWPGEKDFAGAIGQLLGYLVWRDTKSAVVLFIREKSVTAIIEKAQRTLRDHSRFKRQAPDVAGCPIFVLHHDGDPSREIQIALIAIAVPPARPGAD